MILGPVCEVILYVEQMDRQVAFYSEKLGLEVSYPKGKSDYSREMWVTFETGPCTLALHGGGCRRLGKDAPSFVFEVEDVHLARKMLLDRGVSIAEVQEVSSGVFVARGSDPEGNRFSIESHR